MTSLLRLVLLGVFFLAICPPPARDSDTVLLHVCYVVAFPHTPSNFVSRLAFRTINPQLMLSYSSGCNCVCVLEVETIWLNACSYSTSLIHVCTGKTPEVSDLFPRFFKLQNMNRPIQLYRTIGLFSVLSSYICCVANLYRGDSAQGLEVKRVREEF